MWVEESGGAEVPGPEGTSDELLITVEGEQYAAELNLDIDEDGVADTAVIEHADGTVQAFVDEDGDGEADVYLVLDEQRNVTVYAEYDEATGDWVGGEPAGGADPEVQASTGDTITAELPGGEVEVGPATVDTDEDGVNDTAVVTAEDGTTLVFTDVDGDGNADVAVEIDDSGNAVTYEHTGDGEWVEIDGVSPGGTGTTDGAWGRPEPLEGVARIDSVTGQWISQN
ncbi:DUF6802 family protein [Saccharomonospora viridis]|uniref:DUF6802 domain-containing protein n=1 Tax=Saccharomonospora viridis (strain ATCC 15386 / DSM 43017 / JCM 3036 / CCUG 5913 / NBRC 12207 / NCIMB 9602 / P101) TaxID=471857 RepID=C7MRZ5_SACVD|nr:DUF6802 family protein [Saccharomonospora viridis]ACU98851.1 hypothetical protein Svir_39090 [Saccharomonospora viridis DSM 43017]